MRSAKFRLILPVIRAPAGNRHAEKQGQEQYRDGDDAKKDHLALEKTRSGPSENSVAFPHDPTGPALDL
jgi:hypothetical protein